uniref:Uncharacterized protein n=1 Tax=Rhizophora mucronata TaxID=61149 RepID=A0A2P2MKE0_RHIMU
MFCLLIHKAANLLPSSMFLRFSVEDPLVFERSGS